MTPEQVADYLAVDRLNPAYADAVRDLIAERDRLRDDRRKLTNEIARLRNVEKLYNAGVRAWQPVYETVLNERDRLRAALAGLLRHPGIADMDPADKDPEDHALEREARAALKEQP